MSDEERDYKKNNLFNWSEDVDPRHKNELSKPHILSLPSLRRFLFISASV